MDEKSLGEIVNRLTENGHATSEFVALAPFMREEDLERLVRDYLAGGGSFAGLASVAPFLVEVAIKNLFKGFGKE